jgi:ABC-2 type transport system ATP-binding protein
VPVPDDLRLPALVRMERGAEATSLVTSDLAATLVGLVGWAGEAGVPLTGLRTRGATLEDVFLKLTGRSLRD